MYKRFKQLIRTYLAHKLGKVQAEGLRRAQGAVRGQF